MGRFRNAVYLCQLVFVLLPLVAFAGKDEIPTPISTVASHRLEFNRSLGAPWNPTGGLCDSGSQQSPILIYTPGVIPRSDLSLPLSIYTARATGVLTNNNAVLSAEITGPFGALVVGGKSYNFDRLHFHFYSEHAFWATYITRYPVEMHVEYKTSAGEIAVVAQFFEFGDASPFFAQFLDHLADTKSGPVKIANIELPRFDGPYYRYTGSLTTFPCTEGVIWTLLTTPKTLSTSQWNQYLAFPYYRNSRELQYNGRDVYTTPFRSSAELQLPSEK